MSVMPPSFLADGRSAEGRGGRSAEGRDAAGR